jgi:hypothetical protein
VTAEEHHQQLERWEREETALHHAAQSQEELKSILEWLNESLQRNR